MGINSSAMHDRLLRTRGMSQDFALTAEERACFLFLGSEARVQFRQIDHLGWFCFEIIACDDAAYDQQDEFRWEFRVPPEYLLMRHIPGCGSFTTHTVSGMIHDARGLPWWQSVRDTMTPFAMAVGPQQSHPIAPPPLMMMPFTPVAAPELSPAPAGWAAGSENSKTTLGASAAPLVGRWDAPQLKLPNSLEALCIDAPGHLGNNQPFETKPLKTGAEPSATAAKPTPQAWGPLRIIPDCRWDGSECPMVDALNLEMPKRTNKEGSVGVRDDRRKQRKAESCSGDFSLGGSQRPRWTAEPKRSLSCFSAYE